jgi:hypothetical protein
LRNEIWQIHTPRPPARLARLRHDFTESDCNVAARRQTAVFFHHISNGGFLPGSRYVFRLKFFEACLRQA